MRRTKVFTDQQKLDIVREYTTTNITYSAIARKYGVWKNAIAGILIRRGIKIRNDPSLLSRKYNLDHTFFDQIDTEEKAYILGLLYADGYNQKNKNNVAISLKESDKELLEKIKLIVKSEHPLYFIPRKNIKPTQEHAYRFSVKSKQWCEQLEKLGCLQKKTFILKFPNTDQVPQFLLRHFIRGYFDGDGTISISKNQKRYQVALISTLNFCTIVKKHLDELGIISNFCIAKPKTKNKITQQMYIYCDSHIKFLDWLYLDSSIYLPRKYRRYLELKNYYQLI